VSRAEHALWPNNLTMPCRSMVWTHPGVTSWYKNRHNRVTVTSPWRLLDYWKLTQHFVPEDFRAGRPGHAPLIPGQEAEVVASVDQLTVS
jgi:4-hydroxyacetophenone monooxygenase